MSPPVLIVSVSLLCLAWGCGSDDAPGSTGSSGQAGASAAGSSTTGGTIGASGSSAHAGSSSAGSNNSGAAGANAHAGSGGGGGASKPLSEACQNYCDCHEENCATTPIPGSKSCGDFCTAMTEEQLDCRQNMCGLVPAQPDNDHCDHSVGIDQCE